MLHVSARAIHEFRHRVCSARVADLHLPLVVHVAVLSRYRGLGDPLFPGYAQPRAFLPLPSSSSLAYCRRHGRASGGPLAVLPKIESTGAEPAPLARSLLLIGSRARLSRRLRHGSGIGTRSRHTLGFGILAVLWFLTGLEAYRTVRRGNIEAHRRWMIRNFALTLAAVIPRNQLPSCGSPSIAPSRVPTSQSPGYAGCRIC
jgi:hypothetical protein